MKKLTSLFFAMSSLALVACGSGDPAEAAAPAAPAPAATETAAAPEAPAATADFSAAPSGEYTLDKTHGYIVFTYVHQGYSKPFLRWRDWDATLNWDAENPANSTISVSINADSIDTGVDVFDGHLKEEVFFDTANYPEITFASTEVLRSSETEGSITGDLVIKGETHPVTLDVMFNKAGFDGRKGVHKLGFSAKTEVLRSTWGLDLAVPFVSDEVELIIEVEFVMPGEQE